MIAALLLLLVTAAPAEPAPAEPRCAVVPKLSWAKWPGPKREECTGRDCMLKVAGWYQVELDDGAGWYVAKKVQALGASPDPIWDDEDQQYEWTDDAPAPFRRYRVRVLNRLGQELGASPISEPTLRPCEWNPGHGATVAVRCAQADECGGGCDCQRIRQALDLAAAVLVGERLVTAEALHKALDGVEVRVVTGKLMLPDGKTSVLGYYQPERRRIEVTDSLTALLHELWHAYEGTQGISYDRGVHHSTWGESANLRRAERRYRGQIR